MINLFNTCVGKNGNGQIFDVVNNSAFDSLESMMQGFIDLKNEETTIQNMSSTA